MIIIGSGLVGLLCAVFFPKSGMAIAGGVPFAVVSAWIIYTAYFVPYKGGGASMWPIAIPFAGGAAFACGIFSYMLCVKIFERIKNKV